MTKLPDIDIDLPTSFDVKAVFPSVTKASMLKDNRFVKHPCGVYFQEVPTDPDTKLCAIPYDKAPEFGLAKIDFLHLSLLDHFKDKDEIRSLMRKKPDWSILWDPRHTSKLFHLHRHHAVLVKVKPRSVIELADCVALIRPAKKHLIDQYCQDKYKIRPQLYRGLDEDKSSFKRSHAIAYATNIVLQLHLIEQGRL
jgi:hypothetical protein